MEDVVAIEVALEDGQHRYFMTWGRIQDTVDPTELENLVLRHSTKVDLGGIGRSARLCDTLSEASAAPYFYEGLLSFAHQPIPFGKGYSKWRKRRAEAQRTGQDIYFLG